MWDLIVSVPDHCSSFYFGGMDNTLADVLNIFTGTLAFLPGLSKFMILGHTPILLDALSVCSVTTFCNVSLFPYHARNRYNLHWLDQYVILTCRLN